MRLRTALTLSAVAALLGLPALPARAGNDRPTYTYVSLPTLPGGTFVFPLALNNSGGVAGFGNADGGRARHAIVIDTGRGSVTDYGIGRAQAINDHGHAVGVGATGQATLFRDGSAIPLGSLLGEVSSTATGINDFNIAVGISSDASFNATLAVYAFGYALPIDLGPGLQVFDVGSGPAISDDGVIVGTVVSASTSSFRAFRHDLWTGKTTLYTPLAGDTDTWGLAVNHRDQVLGYSFVFGAAEHIGAWDDSGRFTGHFTEGTDKYPTLSNLLAFNDHDQILISETTDGTSYLVPRVGTRLDLASLVTNLPAVDDGQLSFATAINDRGVIVGLDFMGGYMLLPKHDD
jgi:hypothetical protein